jgi:hypothetical protein
MGNKNTPVKTQKAIEPEIMDEVTTVGAVVEPFSASKTVKELALACRDKLNMARRNNLRILWEIGSAVHLVLTNKKYGDSAIELFIAEMDDIAVQKKELYKWRQFYEMYNVEGVRRLMEYGNISWTSVSQLIRIKAPEARHMFEDALAKRQLRPSDLQDSVTKYNNKIAEANKTDNTDEATKGKNQKPDPKQAVKTPTVQNFRKLINYVNKIMEIIPSCIADVNNVQDLEENEDAYERTLDVFDEYNTNRRDKLSQILEALNNALDDNI